MSSVISDGSTSLTRVLGPLPTINEIRSIVEELDPDSPKTLIGVGGGLVLDTTKLVGHALATGDRDFVESTAMERRALLSTVAVPTTAGSGAERTPFAVLYEDRVKRSFEGPHVRPNLAVIDPTLTFSMPKDVAASSGLDAMAHCVESIWACASTPESSAIAQSALLNILRSLEEAVVVGSHEARSEMAYSASEAGRAIAVTRTTAAHALSYYLTAQHGIAHGHAVALTLGAVLVLNSEVDEYSIQDGRGVAHVREAVDLVCMLLGVASPGDAAHRVKALLSNLGLVASVSELGLGDSEIREWVSQVNARRLSNNPRLLTHDDLVVIAKDAA